MLTHLDTLGLYDGIMLDPDEPRCGEGLCEMPLIEGILWPCVME